MEFQDKFDRIGAFDTPEEWLVACRFYARTHAPYFTGALVSMPTAKTHGLLTFGVTKDGVLLWDPEMAKVWSVRRGATVLIHEVGHILRNHWFRQQRGSFEHKLFNFAADAEINDDFEGEMWDPDPDWIYPATLNSKPGKLAEEYYNDIKKDPDLEQKLRQQFGGGECGGSCGKDGKCDGKCKPGGKGQPCSGRCGSGAGGEPLPGEPNGPGTANPEASEGARSQADLDRIRRETARAVADAAAKGKGSVPEGLTRWAQDFMKPAKISWRQLLRQHIKFATSWAAGAVNHTYKKPSRRQSGLGYGAGRPIMPALHAPVPEIFVPIDTSGSMGDEELSIALRELRGVLESTRARVTCVAVDAEVHDVKRCRNIEEAAKMLKGGGGTDFRPAFEYADKARPRPSVIIFVTDGMGDCPVSPPPGMRVIWLLVGKHRTKPPCDWGELVEVDD